jgi:hypothetical protein
VRRCAPHPHLYLGVDDDTATSITPAGPQPALDVPLEATSVATWSSVPCPIEDYQGMGCRRTERSKELVTSVVASWIAVGVREHLEGDPTDAECLGAREKASE